MLGFFDIMARRNIILVGITGVGKTTIGRALAKTINATFIDLDKSIELSCGVDIPTIFAIEGEHGFRRRESDELIKVINGKNYILSTGGGCVILDSNRHAIQDSGSLVIQLVADVDVIVERVAHSFNKRPLLGRANLRDKINELYESRREFYNEVAHHTINTTHYKPYQVINLIKKYLENS